MLRCSTRLLHRVASQSVSHCRARLQLRQPVTWTCEAQGTRHTAQSGPTVMKLYTHPHTRGAIICWWVKELQAQGKCSDIELVEVDFLGKKHKEPEYLKVNPFGRLPALVDGDLQLFESGTIAMYIGEKCGVAGLDTPERRAATSKWVLFANSTLAEALFHSSDGAQKAQVLTTLDQLLEGKSFLEGNALGVADVTVAGCLIWARDGAKLDMSEHENVTRYTNAMASRPLQTLNFG